MGFSSFFLVLVFNLLGTCFALTTALIPNRHGHLHWYSWYWCTMHIHRLVVKQVSAMVFAFWSFHYYLTRYLYCLHFAWFILLMRNLCASSGSKLLKLLNSFVTMPLNRIKTFRDCLNSPHLLLWSGNCLHSDCCCCCCCCCFASNIFIPKCVFISVHSIF